MLPPHAMVTTKNPRRALVAYFCCCVAAAVLLTACTPPGPRALLRGKQLMDKGEYAQALPELQTAVELLPTNAIAWHYFGLASQKVGRTNEAERAYQHALAIDRDLTEARFNLGCLYLEGNRIQDAKAQFTAYNLRKANSMEGLLKLGTTQLRAHEPTAAERTFSEALRVSPQNPEALNGLGLARLERGRAQEAAQAFMNLSRLHTNYGPAWLNLGIVRHQHLKDREGALQAYRQYVSLRPPPPNAVEVLEIIEQLQRELGPQTVVQPPTIAAAQTNAALPPALQPAPRTELSEKAAPPQVRTSPSTPGSSPVTPGTISAVPKSPSSAQPQGQSRPEPAPPSDTRPKAVASSPPSRPTATPTQRESSTPDRQPTTPLVVPRAPAQPAPVQTIAKAPERLAQTNPAPERTVILTNEQRYPIAQDTTATRPATGNVPTPGGNGSLVITTSSVPGQVASKPKRGLLQTLNPVNIFRGEEKTARPAGQQVSGSGSAGAQSSTTNKASQPQVSPTPPAPKPEPRYQYRRPAKPVPGDRKEAERALARGLQAHGAGRLDAASQAYRAAAQADPSFFEAQYNVGLAAGEMGNINAALTAYEDALAILPTSLDARYNFALMLRQGGYFVDAALELERLVEQYPNDTRVRLALGKLYADHKQAPKARLHYSKVLELEPKHPQAGAIRSWMVINPAP